MILYRKDTKATLRPSSLYNKETPTCFCFLLMVKLAIHWPKTTLRHNMILIFNMFLNMFIWVPVWSLLSLKVPYSLFFSFLFNTKFLTPIWFFTRLSKTQVSGNQWNLNCWGPPGFLLVRGLISPKQEISSSNLD